MTERLERRAEVHKLARLLETTEARLGGLAARPAAELRELREQATDRLFDAERDRFSRLAHAAALLPVALVATIAQRALGPLLCARLAGMLDAPRAVEIAGRLGPAFLADVAVELDPRRAAELVGRLPAPTVVPVVRELLARGEHVAMGRFVGHLSGAALAASLAVIDPESLLRIGFVTEDKGRLDAVVGMMGDDELRAVLAAAGEAALWPEAIDLASHLPPARRGHLGDLAAAGEARVMEGMIAAAAAEDLWDALLPVLSWMRPESRLRFATLRAAQEPAALEGMVAAAAREALWPDLLQLAAELPPAQRDAVVGTLLDGPAVRLAGLLVEVADAIDDPGLAGRAVGLLAEVDPDLQARIAGAAQELLDGGQRARLARRARALGVAPRLGAPLRRALGLA